MESSHIYFCVELKNTCMEQTMGPFIEGSTYDLATCKLHLFQK